MIAINDLPDLAICHVCGQPMRVVELGPEAARLGVKVPDGSYVIECCGHELTMEDESARVELTCCLRTTNSIGQLPEP
jgi:hypothetical protein